MSEATILSLRPYVAMLDICVDLPLVTMQTVLAFGPFNTLTSALDWGNEVHHLHKEIESEAEKMDASLETFLLVGLTTRAFIDVRISTVDVLQTDKAGRHSRGLIPQSTAKEDAERMHMHALTAFEGAVAQALGVAKNEIKR